MRSPGTAAERPSILLLGREDNLKELSHLLEPKYDPFTASAVDEVIAIVEMIRFDVVLVVFGDNTSEYATITELRSMPCYQAVPIIACSKQRNRGFENWIRMPFVKDEVLAALSSAFCTVLRHREDDE